MPINPIRILFDDDALLAVDKLSGELVVKGKGRVDRLPLLDFLRKEYPGLKAVHRLDFETSGVVLFAKKAHVLETILAAKFAGWTKVYRAIVLDPIEHNEGVIELALQARNSDAKVPAKTSYRVLERFTGCCLVEATIERGQFHQIRRHFAAIGHPLVLDDEYGNAKLNTVFSRTFKYYHFFLHALSITFPHPVTGSTITITAPMPRNFEKVVGELRKRKI